MTTIGKLKEINVRKLWKHEQYDFSAWLAEESNIEYLNEILGLTLTDIKKEVFVGPYRCDILAKDETTNDAVIIENRLDSTDHDHLGKIITYAAGLDAKYAVWIVTEAKEEHRAAVEWLNNNTTNGVNFFLLEIHAYQIGDSEPAPKFEVIEKPNNYIKNKSNAKDGELSKAQSERLAFWERFNQTLVERDRPFNVRKATTDHWYDVSLGTGKAHIAVTLVNIKKRIGIEVYISDDKELYDYLFDNKEEIEESLGFKMDDWMRLDNKKASRIICYIDGLNFDDHSNYDELINQTIDTVIKIRSVFKKYIK